jgi:D-proline reductase (dithiol) PrdB
MEPYFEIMENRDAWVAEYEAGWKAHYLETGITDFKRYNRVRNKQVPAAAAIRLDQSRLLLISSAGGYLRHEQEPFDAENDLGDYTIRTFPFSTPLNQIAFAHNHYNHDMVDSDPQVALPLRHLEEMTQAGLIGELAPVVLSFMGYEPDATRVVDVLFPAVLEVAKREKIDGALLIPV